MKYHVIVNAICHARYIETELREIKHLLHHCLIGRRAIYNIMFIATCKFHVKTLCDEKHGGRLKDFHWSYHSGIILGRVAKLRFCHDSVGLIHW